MELKIVELNKNELNKVIDLFCLVWGEPREQVKEKTNWAFLNSFSKVLVFKNNKEEIIAVRGGIKWPIIYNNKKFLCFQFHGTCVHPNYRRMGLFTKLNIAFLESCKDEGVELIFNVSVKASKLGYEKLGWQYLKGFHRLTKVHPINAVFKKNIDEEVIVSDKIEIPEIFFLAREKQFKNLINTSYDHNFLNWRLSNKEENYRFFSTENACVIYKTKIKKNRKELIIGDIFLLNKRFKDFHICLSKLLEKEKPYLSFTYIFASHPYYFFYLGFLYLPNPLNYNLNFGTKTLDDKLKISNLNWGVGFLDIDTF
ncbi:GNAT family N-acetyltransferase [Chryseobacterium terrae]|uniref:GNAT family N-acetyltransferase n=1 Tax=Chryseobacterium terrae TaxID=3163299 RepID=A0ABW8Y8H0_9FLAO